MLFKAAFALVAALANISAACASPPPVYNEELQGIMQRGVAEFKVKFQGGSGMQAVELKDGTQNNKERILRKLGDTNELTYTGRVIVVAGEPRRQHKGNGESDVYLERALCYMTGYEPDEKTVFTFTTGADGLLNLDKCGCASGKDNTGAKKARLVCEVENGTRKGQGVSCGEDLGGTCHIR